MRVLLDVNVVLDVLLDRQPHSVASAAVLALAESGRVQAFLAATSVTTIHYLIRRATTARASRRHLTSLLSICEVAPVDGAAVRSALGLGFRDYEDAVVHEVARAARCKGIVTRDVAGFRRGSLPVWAPEELLAVLSSR